MAGMVSFSPEDVIFLLNKWDCIPLKDENILKNYFKGTKAYLRNVWNDVDESRIFRISAIKVSKIYIIEKKHLWFLHFLA